MSRNPTPGNAVPPAATASAAAVSFNDSQKLFLIYEI